MGYVHGPIPSSSTLVGMQLFAQWAWVGPNLPAPCPPLGLSTSNALEVTVQPGDHLIGIRKRVLAEQRAVGDIEHDAHYPRGADTPGSRQLYGPEDQQQGQPEHR